MTSIRALGLAFASVVLAAACGGNVVVDRSTGTTTATKSSSTTPTTTSSSTSSTSSTSSSSTISTTTTTDTTPIPACPCSAVQGFLNGCNYPAPADCAGFGELDCVCATMDQGCAASLSTCFGGAGGSPPSHPGLPPECRNCFVKAIQGPCAKALGVCKANSECQAELDCHKGCNYSTQCNAQCDADHPQGVQDYAALVMCADCEQCGNECASTDLYASYCAYGGK